MGRGKDLGSREITGGSPKSSNMFVQSFRLQSKKSNIVHRGKESLQILIRSESSACNGRHVHQLVQPRALCDATLQRCWTGLGYKNRKPTHACFWRTNSTQASWSQLIESFTKSSYEAISEDSAIGKVKDQLNEALAARRSHEEGNLLPSAIASEICKLYSSLEQKEEKYAFFSLISTSLDVNTAWISKSIDLYYKVETREPAVVLKARDRLSNSLDPPYKHLLKDIGHLEEGVRMLMNMRKDLMTILKERSLQNGGISSLHAFEKHLKQHLAQWFSAGFLNLQRVTWNSPAALLEKIMEYEQVHPTRDWDEFKRRLQEDRRCFIFTHRLLPGEPLVILHTALGDHLRSNMEGIHIPPAHNKAPDNVTAATFYTISSTQKGLSGIDLGNYLIKVAVQELKTEFPTLEHFGTLSPIPGFAKWLHQKLKSEPDSIENVLKRYVSPQSQSALGSFTSWLEMLEDSESRCDDSSEDSHLFKNSLMELCARYLYHEKRRGFALDPVANFHLRNGAVFWRLNWMADRSRRGMDRSYGIMTNYKYNLSQIERNNKQYIIDGIIEVSPSIKEILHH